MNWLFLLLLGSASLAGQGMGVPAPRRLIYGVIKDASDLWIVTHRSGLLSFLGHEHAITAHDWTTRLCMSDPVASGDEASLVVAISSLVIDGDSARALAGLDGQPSSDERREVQRKMLDSEHLDAEAFPQARLDLRAVDNRGESITVEGTLTLHGVRKDVKFPVSIEREDPDRVRLRGELRIRQRDYGIQPESIRGVVKVSNDVDLHFSIVAEKTDDACMSPSPGAAGSFNSASVAPVIPGVPASDREGTRAQRPLQPASSRHHVERPSERPVNPDRQ